jgi:hypothetical protein
MNIDEILAELPKLQASELEAVVIRALELQPDLRLGSVFVASPELLRAIEEADAEPEEHDIPIEEVDRLILSSNPKAPSS